MILPGPYFTTSPAACYSPLFRRRSVLTSALDSSSSPRASSLLPDWRGLPPCFGRWPVQCAVCSYSSDRPTWVWTGAPPALSMRLLKLANLSLDRLRVGRLEVRGVTVRQYSSMAVGRNITHIPNIFKLPPTHKVPTHFLKTLLNKIS